MTAKVPRTSNVMPAAITHPRTLLPLPPPKNSAVIVCVLMASSLLISDESARPVERVTQLLIERVDPRLQTLFPPHRARGVFGSSLHEVGLDPRHVAFELVVGHVRQRAAEHHAAERVHARVDELSRLLV